MLPSHALLLETFPKSELTFREFGCGGVGCFVPSGYGAVRYGHVGRVFHLGGRGGVWIECFLGVTFSLQLCPLDRRQNPSKRAPGGPS